MGVAAMKTQLIELLKRQPFAPFELVLSDGRCILVEAADRVRLGEQIVSIANLQSGWVIYAPYATIAHLALRPIAGCRPRWPPEEEAQAPRGQERQRPLALRCGRTRGGLEMWSGG